MEALKKGFILLTLLIFFQFSAKAGHAELGSHVGYKAIDSTTYEVTVTIYRDCNGIVPATIKLGITGKTTGFFEVVLTEVSTTDITGAYLNCNFISRCTGSFAYGIQKVIYKDTVDISGGACEYRFSYKDCCRNSNITTGSANTGHYNYAMVNKCFGINNSVQANLEPRILIPVGQDIFMTTFNGDKIDKQDSVVYSQADVYEDSVTSSSYSGSWTAQRPISFLGFPNNGLNSPAGFKFDETTSALRFRPTVQNQVTLFCHEAREYRKINGKMELVGLTRMEHEVIVIGGPNNKTPTIKGSSAVACVGQKTCIDFETDDVDKNDSTFLTFKGLPQGATVTYSRKGRLATAQVCYVPTKADVSNNPYQFTVFVSDNSCEISGRSSSSFTYIVDNSPDSTNIEVLSKTTSCSSTDIIVNLKNTSGLTGLSWEIFDEDNLSKSTNDTAKLFFKGSGWKKFFVILKATNSLCTFTLEDSVFIAPQYSLNLNTIKDSTLCTQSALSIFTTPLNGTAPYNYLWSSNVGNNLSTQSSFTQNINTVGKSKYYVFVSDDNGCIGNDSTEITLTDPLIISAGNYPSICGNSVSVQLKANVTAGKTPFKYTWLPNNVTTDTFTVAPTTSTNYILKVEDGTGCIAYDTAKIIVAPQVSFTPPPTTTTCEGNSVTLQAINIVGVAPITFTWDSISATDKFTISNPTQSKAITIEMRDSNNCVATRFVQLVVNQNPEVSAGANKTVCRGVPLFVQATATKGKSPYSFKWSNNVSTDSFTTVLNAPRQFIVEVTDDNGCKATDNVTFQLHPKDNITITQLAPQCETGNPIALTANPNTGIWSGNGVGTGNLFIPQLAGIGVHKATYNYTSSKGCTETDDMYIVVKQVPDVKFTVDKVKGVPNDQFNFTNQTTADTNYTVVWNFGDLGAPGNISQLANPSYTYTKKGLYTVKLTVYNGVCSPQTETKADYILVDSATVSTPEINKTSIKVYPNPANENIFIESENTISVISIYDVAGREVYQLTDNNNPNIIIDIATLKNGVYWIKASFKEGASAYKKIVISH